MTVSKYFGTLLFIFGALIVCGGVTGGLLLVLTDLFGMSLSSREGMLLGAIVQAVVCFILVAFVSACFVSRKPFEFLGLTTAPGWLPLLGVVFAYLIALPGLNQIIYWNSCLTFPDFMAKWGETLSAMEESAQAASSLLLDTSSVGGLFVNLSVIALLTALAEEMFFRGMLQRSIALKCNPYASIWIVALVFSAMHGQVFGFVPRLLLGAWFGYLLFWSRSLWVPIFAHFLNNGMVVLASWLNARGIEFDFDNLGVSQSGFPYAAAVSLVAFIIFVTFFRSFFFKRENRDFKAYPLAT